MLASGTVLSRYVVEGPIGQGGMGAVYRARDTHLDRAVAIKVLSDGSGNVPDTEARERLVREARAAAALSHPNAVSIFDAGDTEHGPFIAMELVEGETLRVRAASGSTEEIVGWMKMAALALGEAHERGIVHRDIKPENLMIRRDGIAKVLDFGIARQNAKALDASAPTHAALPTLTGTGVQIGTPQYMAPEQIKGTKLDGRADQFAWAVTAWEALAGKLPWKAENGALGVVASILEETPDDIVGVRPDVPPRVSAVLSRAMSKRREDRFATMRDLVRALDGLADEDPIAATPPKISVRPPAGAKPVFETRFSEATVKAVIGKALSFEEQGGYSRSELREAALELGISESALEEAAVAIRADRAKANVQRDEDAIKEQIRFKRRRGFYYHLIPYLSLILILLVIGVADDREAFTAAAMVALSWGIGIAIHAMKALSKYVDPDDVRRVIAREERSVARDAARRAALAHKLERQARRNKLGQSAKAFAGAVEEGAASILSAAARQIRENQARIRGEVSPPENVRVASPGPRVHPVSPDAPKTVEVDVEHAAEAEAAPRDRRAVN